MGSSRRSLATLILLALTLVLGLAYARRDMKDPTRWEGLPRLPIGAFFYELTDSGGKTIGSANLVVDTVSEGLDTRVKLTTRTLDAKGTVLEATEYRLSPTFDVKTFTAMRHAYGETRYLWGGTITRRESRRGGTSKGASIILEGKSGRGAQGDSAGQATVRRKYLAPPVPRELVASRFVLYTKPSIGARTTASLLEPDPSISRVDYSDLTVVGRDTLPVTDSVEAVELAVTGKSQKAARNTTKSWRAVNSVEYPCWVVTATRDGGVGGGTDTLWVSDYGLVVRIAFADGRTMRLEADELIHERLRPLLVRARSREARTVKRGRR